VSYNSTEPHRLSFVNTRAEFVEYSPLCRIFDLCGYRIDLELFTAGDIMRSPVVTIMSRQSLYFLAKILLDTSYNGFPVVEVNRETKDEVVHGLITRLLLIVIINIIAFVCKRASGRTQRHQALNEVIARWSFASAGIPVSKEPTGIYRGSVKRPGGVTLVPWQSGLG